MWRWGRSVLQSGLLPKRCNHVNDTEQAGPATTPEELAVQRSVLQSGPLPKRDEIDPNSNSNVPDMNKKQDDEGHGNNNKSNDSNADSTASQESTFIDGIDASIVSAIGNETPEAYESSEYYSSFSENSQEYLTRINRNPHHTALRWPVQAQRNERITLRYGGLFKRNVV
ncbi:unnamed protein product [Caenorhabditis brenneri]